MSDYWETNDDGDLPLFSTGTRVQEQPRELTSRGRMDRFLEFLRRGDVPCSDREADAKLGLGLDRVAALKRQAVQLGYVIDRRGNVYHLVSEPDSELARVRNGLAELYYSTAHWRSKAKQRKDFDGWSCVQCKRTDGLQTHHLCYDLFNEDVQLHLMTLCDDCHTRMHDFAEGSAMHFPSTLPQSVIDRIHKEASHAVSQI